MEQRVVKIRLLKLNHIKNTRFGEIRMPVWDKEGYRAGIMGIYGQNGSGKTAVIDALYMVQLILMGKDLPEELYHYVNVHEEFARIDLEFGIDEQFEVGYTVVLEKTNQKGIRIVREVLSSSKTVNGKRYRRQPFVLYERSDEASIFRPAARLNEVIDGDKNRRATLAASKKVAEIHNCSYIFGETSFRVLCEESGEAFADYAFIIRALHRYAWMDLFVIRNTHSGVISAKVLLPMAFQMGDSSFMAKGDFIIALKEPTVLLEERFEMLIKIIEEINVVLSTIIPDLALGVYDYGAVLQANGSLARKVDLVSERGDIKIPIRYESEGIIKIISILNTLIRAYNNPGICLVVDELDAGIYEYLLGELLDIFVKGGKGQIIFTSHNLRPLEMLPSESILFSSANPDNRYIHMESLCETGNLRDRYLRCITLGGQREVIYTETDSLRIARAFRRAGREMEHAVD